MIKYIIILSVVAVFLLVALIYALVVIKRSNNELKETINVLKETKSTLKTLMSDTRTSIQMNLKELTEFVNHMEVEKKENVSKTSSKNKTNLEKAGFTKNEKK